MSNTHDIEQDGQIIVSGSQSRTHRITVPSGESATFRGRVTDKWGRTSPWSSAITATSQSEGTVERLGLHVTTQELAIWRDRWNNGVSGDSFIDARVNDEKSRVISNRNTFASSPNGHIWSLASGLVTSNGKFSGHDGSGLSTQRGQAARMRDAAFWALMNQDSSLMNTIGGILHQQPDQANCDFANDSRWEPPVQQMIDAMTPGFVVSHPMTIFMVTYSYHCIAVAEGWTNDLTQAQHDKIRDWCVAWGMYCEDGAERRISQVLNRDTGQVLSTNVWTFRDATEMYIGSPTNRSLYDRYNNRFFSCIRAMSFAGILFDNTFLLDMAQKAHEEFIIYALLPHGAVADMSRSYAARWQQAYIVLQSAHMMSSVDALARYSSDRNLYGFETTDGVLDTGGNPQNFHGSHTESAKSYHFWLRSVARYGNLTYNRQTPHGRFDFRDPDGSTQKIWSIGQHDAFVQSSLAFPDDQLLKDYYRGINGQPPWEVRGNGGSDLNDAFLFPAPYLMWAGLEGQVWPYPGVPQP